MNETAWTYLLVTFTFSAYIGIAIYTRVRSTKGFYVAGQGVPSILNGMATGADWMSAASFLSMAGLISFSGYSASVYLIGWTGGYVLLAMLLAPYLRKFGQFTVPDFVGARYYSNIARLVAIICAIFVSLTYVAGQMRGVGIVFSNFLGVPINLGVIIGMIIVFLYATLGGMKGITYTQVAQYVVLIIAFLIPAIAISHQMTGNWVPQIGFGSKIIEGENAGMYLLETLDKIHADLGLPEYTAAWAGGKTSMLNMVLITISLMAGTAGLPHVIIRFYTVKDMKAARWSAFWALLFIGLLYTTAPAVSAFARVNMIQTLHEKSYAEVPKWYKTWESSQLVAWLDKNGDGVIQYGPGAAFSGKPVFLKNPDREFITGSSGEPKLDPEKNTPTETPNELYVDRDIMVLANPQIANLPYWVVGLVAAGGLAAALSTAAGLLLVISSAISHDLMKNMISKNMTEKTELVWARIAAAGAVIVAGLFGINPPGFVGEVVAFAFGLAASSFFPAIILGIFSKRTTKEGAIAGMVIGIAFTFTYIAGDIWFWPKAFSSATNISTAGIGTIGMILNFIVTILVSKITPAPPLEVQNSVENIRHPGEGGSTPAPLDH